MAVLKQPYLHKSTRLYSALFGMVFSNIKIQRVDGQIIEVPISFAQQQKYNVRNEQQEDPNAVRIRKILPRMSFSFNGWNKDAERHTSRFNKLVKATDTAGTVGQYNRVAYTFAYDLHVQAKNIEDMFQIGEAIMAIFNPSITVVLQDNPDLAGDSAITIRLLQPDLSTIYEGSFEETNIYELTFNFELDGWIYQPTLDMTTIQTITLNYGDLDTSILDSTEVISNE